jgi:hydrogenase small subunit
VGHPCFGCAEKGVGFATPLHQLATLKEMTPPVFFGDAFPNKQGVSPGIKTLAAGSIGLVAGAAGGVVLTGLGAKKGGNLDQRYGQDEKNARDKEE